MKDKILFLMLLLHAMSIKAQVPWFANTVWLNYENTGILPVVREHWKDSTSMDDGYIFSSNGDIYTFEGTCYHDDVKLKKKDKVPKAVESLFSTFGQKFTYDSLEQKIIVDSVFRYNIKAEKDTLTLWYFQECPYNSTMFYKFVKLKEQPKKLPIYTEDAPFLPYKKRKKKKFLVLQK